MFRTWKQRDVPRGEEGRGGPEWTEMITERITEASTLQTLVLRNLLLPFLGPKIIRANPTSTIFTEELKILEESGKRVCGGRGEGVRR